MDWNKKNTENVLGIYLRASPQKRMETGYKFFMVCKLDELTKIKKPGR